jgi:hypothetical protein
MAEELPKYDGKTIDLATFPAAKLYKGTESKFVADNLEVKGIFNEVSKEQNTWRLQIPFVMAEQSYNAQDIWLQLRTNVVAMTVSINGQLLLENGRVALNVNEEVAGKSLVRQLILRELLLKDVNVIQIEFSNFSHQQGAIFRDISIGPLREFQHQSQIMSTAPLVLSGIFLFAVISNVGLYLAMGRQAIYTAQILLFSLCFLQMLNETMYWNGLSNTVSLIDKSTFTSLLEYAIFGSLMLTLHIHFKFKTKWLFIWIMAFIFLVITAELIGIHSSLVLAPMLIAICVFAIMNRVKDGAYMLTFVAFFIFAIFIDQSNVLDNASWVLSNFIVTSFVFKIDNLALALFAILMMVISSRRILRNTIALHKAKFQLEQLEFQFIQKHIQPHFLMNTLMSLQQLVKKDQQLAGEMIEALSEEFYLMTQMLKRPEVEIEQEIRMCRNYLKIMSLQHKANFELKTQNISGNEYVPPAVFHTIIENGLTHGFKGVNDIEFNIVKQESNSLTRYILSNNGAQSTNELSSTGSGLDYIKSRLQHWKPNRGNIKSNMTDNGWQTIIEIEC